jgi:hypothetical protein
VTSHITDAVEQFARAIYMYILQTSLLLQRTGSCWTLVVPLNVSRIINQPTDKQERILEIISFSKIFCACEPFVIPMDRGQLQDVVSLQRMELRYTVTMETLHCNKNYVCRILFHPILSQLTQNIIEMYEHM